MNYTFCMRKHGDLMNIAYIEAIICDTLNRNGYGYQTTNPHIPIMNTTWTFPVHFRTLHIEDYTF